MRSLGITNGSEHMFKRAFEMHIGSMLPIFSPLKTITLIPIVPAKKFWSFVKCLKKDESGINTLRENGILKTCTLDKANICNRQFQSPPKAQVPSPLWVRLQLTKKGSVNC